ncbi:SDR family NAD(P)-dependent oxidoreductase [Pontibacter burrus]|uniref:SDR family NAD(P)-dependent oxidoreductase n=1 Tax=Pontibacter burrus TaxID=2704466 RepID=A0A6B3LZB6_9BACT|nr:SDR family NAD(P)-dependent oxidoreductase [Pontibacter burrus]
MGSVKLGLLGYTCKNVGTNIRKPTADYSADEYDFIMNTNLRSAFELAGLFYPLLAKSGRSNIVHVTSVAGLTPLRTGSIYGMTKTTLTQLTQNYWERIKGDLKQEEQVKAYSSCFNYKLFKL